MHCGTAKLFLRPLGHALRGALWVHVQNLPLILDFILRPMIYNVKIIILYISINMCYDFNILSRNPDIY